MKAQAIFVLVYIKVPLEHVRVPHVVTRRLEAYGLVESAQAYERVVQLPEGSRFEGEFEDSHNVSRLSTSAHNLL